jgi:hypothetical protein
MTTSRDKARRDRAPRKRTTSSYQDNLRNHAKIIKILERIDGQKAKLIRNAVQIIQHPPADRNAQIYAQFLKDIIRHASPGHALLCAANFGKQRGSRLNESERADIVQFVKENKEDLSCKLLASLAEEYGIGSVNALADTAALREPEELLSNFLHGQSEVPIRREGEPSKQSND